MQKIKFEWDQHKNKLNARKHGIAFEEVVSIFNDPNVLSISDEEHSSNEKRWISMGINHQLKILVVVHLLKENNIIRIISARKATKVEAITYYERTAE